VSGNDPLAGNVAVDRPDSSGGNFIWILQSGRILEISFPESLIILFAFVSGLYPLFGCRFYTPKPMETIETVADDV